MFLRMMILIGVVLLGVTVFAARGTPGTTAFLVTVYALFTQDEDLLFSSATPDEALDRIRGETRTSGSSWSFRTTGAAPEASGDRVMPRDFTIRESGGRGFGGSPRPAFLARP